MFLTIPVCFNILPAPLGTLLFTFGSSCLLLIQSPRHVLLFQTPWTIAHQAFLSVPLHLREFDQVHVHCIGDAIQPSHPLRPSSPKRLFTGIIFARCNNTPPGEKSFPLNLRRFTKKTKSSNV